MSTPLPFVTERLPPGSLNWNALIPRLGRANRALAGYAGILEAIPNQGLLLSPLTTQEAVLSSKIEGTQATLGDVLKFEAGERPLRARREADIHEVLNYRKALLAGESEVARRPFSLQMLRAMHALLMRGVRGADKEPGLFRRTQNWIGLKDRGIEEARFVPPAPETVVDHMEALERYYHSDQPDALAQLAVVHAQFEIVHPFLDGNGRLGRMLIPLFLFEKKLLKRPTFYLSAWLESHNAEYVRRLRALGSEQDSWTPWVEFFLQGIEEQANLHARTVQRILTIYERLKARSIELTHSQYAIPLLDQAFRKPVFTSGHLDFGKCAPSKQAVANLLRALKDGGVLKVVREGSGRRPTVYALTELVNACEGRRVL